MVSGSGIQYLLKDLYDSDRILQQHFFPFDVSRLGGIGRSMFHASA
jgi:hypothetical protein